MRANVLLIATLAGTVLLMAALYRPLDAATDYVPSPVTTHKAATASGPEQIAALSPSAQELANADHRNLFDYVNAPAPVAPPAPVVKKPEPVVAPVAVAQPPAAQPPPEPEFTYRYLGTFGSGQDPIAVFSRDGEIVNARGGDTVGGFKVERVGFEAVNLRTPANNQRTLPNRP